MHSPPLQVMPAPDGGAVVRLPDGITLPGGTIGDPLAEINVADRYLKFEYLPRTEGNLALADIRAQHPDATVAEWEVPADD
jgi:hypothetical protein